jgi:hypothetical protein
VNAVTDTATTDSKAPRQSFPAFTAAGDSIHEMLFRGPSEQLSLLENNLLLRG